jgi:hypothetical protein
MNRKGFSQTLLFVIIGILIIGLGAYFIFHKGSVPQNHSVPAPEIPKTSSPQNNTQPEATVKRGVPTPFIPIEKPPSTIALTEYGRDGLFYVPPVIERGKKLPLKWTSDPSLANWGGEVTICLIGLDDQKQSIDLKSDKGLCYPGMDPYLYAHIKIATTALASGEYKWLAEDHSDEFVTPPKSYKLSVRVLDALPTEGRSEWAGTIAESISTEFTFE